ncbi:hypothetical protein Smp_190190 [Schistosoma mansoni]|uniref:hypothetical protein n=1 Tax=Schistosoma mansoni TaxID=6183 RepID=UPI00022DC3A6|nr:hypothetical protein Smp_190190 [Schistosoma mansoni]|eukprot:XP_018653755.1 hypothetical protein Smp_190190 [Schistosoma mansoni]
MTSAVFSVTVSPTSVTCWYTKERHYEYDVFVSSISIRGNKIKRWDQIDILSETTGCESTTHKSFKY